MNRSEQQGELAGALAKAQLEFDKVVKGVENPFYSEERGRKVMYADLAQILEAVQKPMARQGLVLIQEPKVDPEKQMAGCVTSLVHSSGQFRECELMLPATTKTKVYGDGGKFTWGTKFDAQTIGIAITYSRRYTAQTITGVAAEDDDDANGLSVEITAKEAHPVGTKEAANAVAQAKIQELNNRKTADLTPQLAQSIALTKPPIPAYDPFSTPLDPRPVITKITPGTGAASGVVYVEWDGEKLSCWNKGIHPYLLVGIPATFEVKTTKSKGKAYNNIVRAISIGDTKFDMDNKPMLDVRREVAEPHPFAMPDPDELEEFRL